MNAYRSLIPSKLLLFLTDFFEIHSLASMIIPCKRLNDEYYFLKNVIIIPLKDYTSIIIPYMEYSINLIKRRGYRIRRCHQYIWQTFANNVCHIY